MSIFNENIEYNYENLFISKLFDIGERISMPHDTFYCSTSRLTLFTNTNFSINENIDTVSDFIKLNNNKLNEFYSQYSSVFDIKTKENNIELHFKK
jgi:hypothetical protein